MKIRRERRLTLVGGGAGLLLLATGCPNKSAPSSDEYIIDCATADAGQPEVSDENFARFTEAEAAGTVKADACKSPELTHPAPGTALDSITPPTFSFNLMHATCARPVAPSRQQLGCQIHPTPPRWRSLLETGGNLLEGTAEAHCGAITGENYVFRLFPHGQKDALYTATLSVTSFTPDAKVWQKALSGRSGQTLDLTLESAYFLRGDINDGPYVQPQPYTFTVGK